MRAARYYGKEDVRKEIVAAAVDPIPENRTRFVGDLSSFTPIAGE